MTPESASRHTLQKVGLAWEQAYQLCMPEKCSMLNCVACGAQPGCSHGPVTPEGPPHIPVPLPSILLSLQSFPASRYPGIPEVPSGIPASRSPFGPFQHPNIPTVPPGIPSSWHFKPWGRAP